MTPKLMTDRRAHTAQAVSRRLAFALGQSSIWQKRPLFPQPVKINMRTFYTQRSVDNYKRSLLQQALSARA